MKSFDINAFWEIYVDDKYHDRSIDFNIKNTLNYCKQDNGSICQSPTKEYKHCYSCMGEMIGAECDLTACCDYETQISSVEVPMELFEIDIYQPLNQQGGSLDVR